DENCARGFGVHQRVATVSGREVSGDPAQLCVRYARPHTGDGPIDVSLRKPVDDDSRATLREATGDGKADTARRAGDDRSHARKVDLHSTFPRFHTSSPSPATPNNSPPSPPTAPLHPR